MTMHIEGPWLSTTGKKKGKQKFRSAEHARRSRELADSWSDLQKRWGVEQDSKKRSQALTADTWRPEPNKYRGSEEPRIPSLPFTGGPCALPKQKVYTGSKVKGIGTMHKSNAVPIFSDEEAQDIAKMRR